MNKNREIFGWVMYDFANSSFATTILAAVLPIYFSSIIPREGVEFWLLERKIVLDASALWAYTISFSTLIVAVISPVLGAIADYSDSKKKFLFFYCYLGCLFSALLYFVKFGDYWMAVIFFALANIGFAGGNVFYNAFLPEIADMGEMDWISGKGYAYGYLGGGLLLVLNLLMIKRFSLFGIPNQEVGTRLSFISVGLWWGIFSIPLFAFVREKRKNLPMPGGRGYVYQGFNKIYITFKKIKNFNELVKFLISFLIYNDGIQTVVSMAVIFGRSALNLSTTTLIGTLLLIQFIGIPGSLIFGKLAERIGSKRTIFLTLIVWIGIVFYAYFMSGSLEFWILGGFVGLVLGGSQAISRSLYGSLIPERNTAEFFGFFAISNKFASIFGPLTFGVIESITGNPRKSILSVEIFFIIGIILLNFVNVKKGLEQAKVVI